MTPRASLVASLATAGILLAMLAVFGALTAVPWPVHAFGAILIAWNLWRAWSAWRAMR